MGSLVVIWRLYESVVMKPLSSLTAWVTKTLGGGRTQESLIIGPIRRFKPPHYSPLPTPRSQLADLGVESLMGVSCVRPTRFSIEVRRHCTSRSPATTPSAPLGPTVQYFPLFLVLSFSCTIFFSMFRVQEIRSKIVIFFQNKRDFSTQVRASPEFEQIFPFSDFSNPIFHSHIVVFANFITQKSSV